MITKLGKTGKTNHVFTSEKEFTFLEDWILQTKGKDFHASWKLLEPTDIEASTVYEEWKTVNGITHIMTEDE